MSDDDDVVFVSETKKRPLSGLISNNDMISNSKKLKQSKLNVNKKIIETPLSIEKRFECEEFDLGKGSIIKYWKRWLSKEKEEKLFYELESTMPWVSIYY
jgi:hypothetical protein